MINEKERRFEKKVMLEHLFSGKVFHGMTTSENEDNCRKNWYFSRKPILYIEHTMGNLTVTGKSNSSYRNKKLMFSKFIKI